MYFSKVKCANTNDNRKNGDGPLNQSSSSSLKNHGKISDSLTITQTPSTHLNYVTKPFNETG